MTLQDAKVCIFCFWVTSPCCGKKAKIIVKHLFDHIFPYVASYPANCRDPGRIVHGRKLGDDFSHGKSIEFVCDGKYSLEGESRLTCNDGNWNFDRPQCKGNSCTVKLYHLPFLN